MILTVLKHEWFYHVYHESLLCIVYLLSYQNHTVAYLGHCNKQVSLIRAGEILIRPGRLCILPVFFFSRRAETAYSAWVDYFFARAEYAAIRRAE